MFLCDGLLICIGLLTLLLTGSTDGKVHVWSTETGMRVGVLQGDHTGPVQCVQFNPKYMMLATACSSMVSTKYWHQSAQVWQVQSTDISLLKYGKYKY